MKKEKYETPEVEIVKLEVENVLCASPGIDEDYSGGEEEFNPFSLNERGFTEEKGRF